MLTVCCRICLKQINFNQMLSLFQTYKGFVIRDALLDLFNIQILPTEMVSTICKECVAKVCTVRHIRDEFIKQDERYREMLRSSPAKDDSDEEKLPDQKPDIRTDPSPTVESTTGEDKPASVEDTDST
uniref:ZAD domain-containing protein n=1 Tax=Anopheles dirus TaxID=7168 RepID=A0A182NWL8_9DIPT